jgi:hypothetical protein
LPVNTAVNENWRVDRLLPGGWQEGAWLLRNGAGERAVLKLHLVEQERVVAAESRIELARSHGWPTPAWLAIGRMHDGSVWVLQEYVAGRRPERLDARVAAGLTEALAVQVGLGNGTDGWGEWACGVVFEDWSDYRVRVITGFPGGGEVVRLVDAIAATCAGGRLAESDLVHGNFGLVNAIDDGKRVWLVDAHRLGSGPVAYDVAEAVVTASARASVTAAGVEMLWRWATDHLNPADIAICTASVALTMADAYRRLGHSKEAVHVAPHVLETLNRAHSLVR